MKSVSLFIFHVKDDDSLEDFENLPLLKKINSVIVDF